jgi:cyclophilin family peptidyl-prolyl cis-trans isomerase
MANGGMMAKGGKAYYLKPQENIDKLFERQKKRLADMKRNDDQLMLLQGINYLNKKNDEDEEKYVILFFESETPFTRFDLEYHREKLIKLGYLADIDETYLVTPKGEEYLKQHNEKELARKMANGGMMAKGGVIEEGDDVFVKPEKLNAEVVRITGENVVVEFYDRRPEGGEKRGNYKIKDLKKLANGGMMADGGKVRWQDVYVGDNALVIAENKMGMVVKPYGRRFHLKFPDGSEKTYSAEELEFFKDEEFAKGGYTNKRNVLSLVVKNPNKNGIKKYLSINPKDFLDGLHEYAKGGKLTDDYTYIKRSEVEHVIYRDSNGKEQLDFKPKNGFWVSKKALVDAGMNETKAKFDAKEVANELTALSNKAWDTLSIQSGSEIYASDDLQENLADEYRKVGIDKIYGQLTQPERKKVSAVLTDENEHSLRNYLALRGYNGEAEFKNYAKMYDESFAKFGYRSNWNPKNVDLKLGSFAKGGMMTDDEGNSINLKVGDKVVEYKRPSSDKPKKQYGGQGEIISINGAMAKVFFDSTNYEKFYPLKDLKKMANGGMMAKGGTIADGEKLPEDMGRYFIKTSKTKVVNMSDLIPLRKRATGIANAEKNMKMAYDGEMDKRKPITIYKSQRKYRIMDGNSTYAVAKANGWETIWAEIVKNPNMKNGLKRTDDIFSRAKSIRKEGEAWKDALQRAKAMK